MNSVTQNFQPSLEIVLHSSTLYQLPWLQLPSIWFTLLSERYSTPSLGTIATPPVFIGKLQKSSTPVYKKVLKILIPRLSVTWEYVLKQNNTEIKVHMAGKY